MSPAPAWPHGGRCRICVSVAEHEPAVLHERIAALGAADLIEIRLDALDAPEALGPTGLEELVRRSPVPVGFTARPEWQGGGYRGSEDARSALLISAAASGAAFVDVELDAEWVVDALREAPCPVVVSHHWERPRPADLDARVDRLRELRPSLAKLVATAETPADSLPLLRAGDSLIGAGQPAACFCMGKAGRASRLLAAGRGAGLIYAAARTEHEVAPGQWPLEQLADEFRLQGWGRGIGFCGLIGHPIGHSLSPAIFNSVFQRRGAELAYVPLAGDDLVSNLDLAVAMDFRGLSVTMPFKEEMARRCSELDPLSRVTGAVNTVVASPEGWVGYNTDGGAVVDALAERMALGGADVALLGAGGAARAAAVALRRAGADLTVLNRTVARAEEIAVLAGGDAGPIRVLEQRSFAAVINATPVGLLGSGMRDETPFPSDWLNGSEVVFDMVYRPRTTRLLREAADRGCTTVEGLEMFARQAAAQYGLLTGDPDDRPLASMRAAAESALVDD